MQHLTPERLVERLRAALGEQLRAVVLYGSAVAGERVSTTSDYNVLVIADSLPLGAVRSAGKALREWVEAGNAPPLMFSMEEWKSSADVFPMEYSDILEYNRVLYGEAPFAGISVDRGNLRLQVEQDARGKLFHLRRALIAAGDDAAQNAGILEYTVSKLMVLYRGLLRLHGAPHPTDYDQLTREAASVAGFDPAPVLRAVNHARGTTRIAGDEALEVAEAYLHALEQLVRHLDGIE